MHYGQNEGFIEQTYEELKSAAKVVGLSINTNNTKTMVQSRHNTYWKGYEDRRRYN
jgi:hypothetical protein